MVDFVHDTYDTEIAIIAADQMGVVGEDGEGFDQHFPLIMPWMIYRMRFTAYDFGPKLPKPGQVIADVFLAQKMNALSDLEKDIIKAGRESALGFYKVLASRPDGYVKLRNMLTGSNDKFEDFWLYNKTFSETCQINAYLFALIIDTRGIKTMEGVAPFAIAPVYGRNIKSLRKELQELYGHVTVRSLQDFEFDLLDFYCELLEAMFRPPRLQNTSGERLCFHKLVYEHNSFSEVALKLVDLARNPKEIDRLKKEIGSIRNREFELKFSWLGTKINEKLGGPTIFGDIFVEANRLTVKVNSTARSNRIKKELKKRLGSLIALQADLIEGVDPEKIMKQAQEINAENNAKSFREFDELSLEEKEALVDRGNELKSWWYDRSIPFLNNETPREAARTKEGRERLEELIEHYGYNRNSSTVDEHLSVMNPTENEIRQELGL